jgi:uncharacterized protein (TIGR03083 family)
MVAPEVRAALFRESRRRIVAVGRGLDAEALAAPVPACPEWTVRDLFAHLSGVSADVANDNLEGAPHEAWTAAQVAARAGRDLAELLAEWEEFAPRWEEITRRNEHPSFVVRRPYLDTGTHEGDLYGALGLGRRPPAELTLAIADSVVRAVAGRFDGLGVFTVITPDREYRLGSGDTEASVRVDTYELSRAVFGRRSRAQIESWDWSGAPGPFAERLPVMPVTECDLAD